MAVKYFVYSKTQFDFLNKIHGMMKNGSSAKRKYVFQNGKKLEYTEIVSDPTKSKYPDAKVVASGDISKMIYK